MKNTPLIEQLLNETTPQEMAEIDRQMSNNKQSMKLYTKEDFLKAAEFCEVSMIDAKYIIERIDEVTDPIELPSDEEIDEEMWANVEGQSIFFPDAFRMGAKWMRDKIQGGNNEQQ